MRTMVLLAAAGFSGCARGYTTLTPSGGKATRSPAGPALEVRESESPARPDSREPELFATADGRVIMSWVEKTGEEAPRPQVRRARSLGVVVAGHGRGGRELVRQRANFPSVVALTDGSLAAHWLVKSGPGTYAYDVHISRSKDGGKSWGKPVVPHTDGTKTEHGFVSLMPLPDGRLGAVWVDGRATKDVEEGHGEEGLLPISMQLRYAAVPG